MPNFLRFSAVGAVGFAVDTSTLYLLMHSMDILYARCVSLFCSMLTTWLLNRMFTFKRVVTPRGLWIEVCCYFAITVVGACINYFVFASLMTKSIWLLRLPIVGVAVGTGAALFWNYVALKHFLYRD